MLTGTPEYESAHFAGYNFTPDMDLLDRLTDRTMFDETVTGCWLWQGATDQGYGSMRWEGCSRRVHQLGWEALRGPRPSGLDPDHLCRTHACWNPNHLEWVPRAENTRRGNRHPGDTCHRGHEWTGANTYVTPAGARQCRACKRLRERGDHRNGG